MHSIALKELGEKKGFKEERTLVHGLQDGYYITIGEVDDMKQLAIGMTLADNDPRKKQIGEYIAKQAKDMVIISATFRSGYLDMLFKSMPGISGKIEEFIDSLIPFLKQLAVPGADTCFFCGSPITDCCDKALMEGVVIPMHSGCIDAFSQKLEEVRTTDKGASLNYGKGITGALIGGLIGTIPWIIIYMLGYIAALAGYFIGYGAKAGYEILGGKAGKMKPWIIMMVITVCVILGQYMGVISSLAQKYDVSVSEVTPFFWTALGENSRLLSTVIAQLVIGLIFAFIAVYRMFMTMHYESREGLPKIRRLEA